MRSAQYGARRNPDRHRCRCNWISAVAALASRGIEPIIVSDYNAERRKLARDAFGAHILVDPADNRRSTCSGVRAVSSAVLGAGRRLRVRRRSRSYPEDRGSAEIGARIYCAGGWYTGDTLSITDATRQGVTIQFGGGPHPQDWYGMLEAIRRGRLDPMPSVGKVIALDEVPDALDLARKSEGPPRIVVHPNGDVV